MVELSNREELFQNTKGKGLLSRSTVQKKHNHRHHCLYAGKIVDLASCVLKKAAGADARHAQHGREGQQAAGMVSVFFVRNSQES